MQVLSPVGKFHVGMDGVRFRGWQPVVDVSMGAWRSEATLDRKDVAYVVAVVGVLIGVFGLGRLTSRGIRA